MLYVENDRDLVAAVSRALGESRKLVRHRGFQLIEIVVLDGDRAMPDGGTSSGPDDAVDLATVAGLDWDDFDDSRLHCGARGRRCRRVA